MSPVYKTSVNAGTLTLRVVIVEEFPGYWLAQALECDVNSAHSTPHRAVIELQQTILQEVNWAKKKHRPLFFDQDKAPADYVARYHSEGIELPPAN